MIAWIDFKNLLQVKFDGISIQEWMEKVVVDVVQPSACRWSLSTAKQHLCSKRNFSFIIINMEYILFFSKIDIISKSNSIKWQVVSDKFEMCYVGLTSS